MVLTYKGIKVIINDEHIVINNKLIDFEGDITLEKLNDNIIKSVNTILNPTNTNTCPNCGSINNSIVLHHPVHNQEPDAKVLRCFDCKNDYIINDNENIK